MYPSSQRLTSPSRPNFLSSTSLRPELTRPASSLSTVPRPDFRRPVSVRPDSLRPAVSSPHSYTQHLPMDVSSRFGRRLRELRREHQFTQLRMAVDFGIDRSFISDVERGKKSISLGLLEVIALGFHLSLSDLLSDL